MKEVKCQILSHNRVSIFKQYTIRVALFFMVSVFVGFSHVYAQQGTSPDASLEPAVSSSLTDNTIQAESSVAQAPAKSSQQSNNISQQPNNIVVEQDLESLKKTALELNRDLLILEEELLFPSNTQVVVFLSTDVGKFFTIDSVKLKINNQLVASHLYTPYENDALVRGGVQRLYIGNLKQGQHEITAVYTGEGPDQRKYKRAATLNIEKDDDPIMLELLVQDATTNMQPTFVIKEWEL